MFRKLTVLLLALLLPASALAEVYEGTAAALAAVTVTAERAGVVGAAVEAGSRVEAGDALAELKPERAFASQDGMVSLVYAGEGDAVDGTVLEVGFRSKGGKSFEVVSWRIEKTWTEDESIGELWDGGF